jgi:hypothetical protein
MPGTVILSLKSRREQGKSAECPCQFAVRGISSQYQFKAGGKSEENRDVRPVTYLFPVPPLTDSELQSTSVMPQKS